MMKAKKQIKTLALSLENVCSTLFSIVKCRQLVASLQPDQQLSPSHESRNRNTGGRLTSVLACYIQRPCRTAVDRDDLVADLQRACGDCKGIHQVPDVRVR